MEINFGIKTFQSLAEICMDQTCDQAQDGKQKDQQPTQIKLIQSETFLIAAPSGRWCSHLGQLAWALSFIFCSMLFIDREKLHQSYHAPSISNKTFGFEVKSKQVQIDMVLFICQIAKKKISSLYFHLFYGNFQNSTFLIGIHLSYKFMKGLKIELRTVCSPKLVKELSINVRI